MDTINGTERDPDVRKGVPRAAILCLCGGRHDFMTFAALCTEHQSASPRKLYCVIGTDYGYLHTSAGDIRTWRSASGARRGAARYAARGG